MHPTATLVAIAKNEAPYLAEWIAFHRAIGFDRIVIFDNGSDDGSTAILERLNAVGTIEHVPWPNSPGRSPQLSAYAAALRNVTTDFVAYLDIDEFLNLKQDETVGEFLSRFDGDVSAIGINWRIFGSSGHKAFEPELITGRFQLASPSGHHLNRHIKSFTRAAQANSPHIHFCSVNAGRRVQANGVEFEVERMGFATTVTHEVAQINHYFTKSLEEYTWKRARGNANHPAEAVDKLSRYSDKLFIDHDLNDDADDSILRFRDLLLHELTNLVETLEDRRYATTASLTGLTAAS